MDDFSLEELQAALQSAQEQKSATRLSERNVVELVNKLQELGLLGSDLLHSTSGREYITSDRLCQEVKQAVSQAGGRVAVVDLPAQLGVDLLHCESQVIRAVKKGKGSLQNVQGELITQAYFDSIAAEIDELLQEAGVVALSNMARRFKLGSELLLSAITARLDLAIHGRLEGGILYTSTYISRIKAQVCGALRGASFPVNLGLLAKELDLQSTSSASKTVSTLVEKLGAEGAISGTLKAGTGTWIPTIFSHAQQVAAGSFYRQNDFIGYDTLEKMGIADGRDFMATLFPSGLALESAFVSPNFVNQLEAAVDDVIASSTWLDALSVLPSSLEAADIRASLQRIPAFQTTGAGKTKQERPAILAGTCVLSASLQQTLHERILEEARAAAQAALQQRRASVATASTSASDTPSGATAAVKKVDPNGNDSDGDWDAGKGGNKKKKGGKRKGSTQKGKSAQAGSLVDKGAKGKSGVGEANPGSARLLSLEALCSKVHEWLPDAAGAGEDGTFVEVLAAHLRPAALAEYERMQAAIFSAGAEARGRKRDAIAKALLEAHKRLLLYSQGSHLLEGDEATYTAVQRHLLRSTGMQVLDCLLRYQAVDLTVEQPEDEKETDPCAPLAAADRTNILKRAPQDITRTANAAFEALSKANVQSALSALEIAAEAVGLQLRKLDKKAEKVLLAEHRRTLEMQLEAECSPATALSLAVPLLVMQVHGCAISIPGRVLAGVIALLKDGMQPASHKQLVNFHARVVSSLRGHGEGEEGLEGMLPDIKAIAGLGVSETSISDNIGDTCDR